MLDRRSIAPVTTTVLLAAVLGAHAQGISKFPDWSGQRNRVPDGGVPRYDPTKPIRKQQAPLKPQYQALFEARFPFITAASAMRAGRFALAKRAIVQALRWNADIARMCA